MPPLKATAAHVALPLPADAGLTDTGKAILAAAADGNLPPDVASQLIAALGALAKVAEIDELEKRITALEEKQHGDTT